MIGSAVDLVGVRRTVPETVAPIPTLSDPLLITPPRRLGYAARFAVYGLAGMCLEVLFTSVATQFDGGDVRLKGWSYLWMHPIWGIAFLTCDVLGQKLDQHRVSWIVRAPMYVVICFALEIVSGSVIRAFVGTTPWDYSAAPWNVCGLIRLDYAPLWALCGLGGERLARLLRRVQITSDE